eukprot:SAG22_NODE_2097_length_3017_cov_1.949280_2_plen_240_part_00
MLNRHKSAAGEAGAAAKSEPDPGLEPGPEPEPAPPDMGAATPTQVTVTIVKAVELPAMDSNGLSDPYVEVSVRQRVGGAQKGKTSAKSIIHKTEVRPGTLSPEWNETCMLSDNLSRVDNSHVAFKVFDQDKLTDDFIGECRLELADVAAAGAGHSLVAELPLTKRNGEPIAVRCAGDRPRLFATVKLEFGEVVKEHVVKTTKARWFQTEGVERDYKIESFLGCAHTRAQAVPIPGLGSS